VFPTILSIIGSVAVVAAAYLTGRLGRRNELMKLAVSAGLEAFRRDRRDQIHQVPRPLSFYIFFHYNFLHLVERGKATPDRLRDLNRTQSALLDAVLDSGLWSPDRVGQESQVIQSRAAAPVDKTPPHEDHVMDEREVAVRFYEAGTSVLIARIKQRDAFLLFFVASAGTVAGLAYSKKEYLELLLFIPYLAGACGAMMSYQTILVDSIADYYFKHLQPVLGKTKPFELTTSFAYPAMRGVILRTAGNFLTLILPVGIALYRSWKWPTSPMELSIWTLGLLFGLVGPSMLVWYDRKHVRAMRTRVPIR
jgi:hypothetical protein